MPPAPHSLPKGPIIDTNILFDFLVWRYLHTATQTDIPASLFNELSSKPLQQLTWYLDAAKPIRTSFHVIAEIHGVSKIRTGWTGRTRASFWRFASKELFGIELGEHPVKIAEMDLEDLALLGPADASILILGTRLEAAVLTEDQRLRNRCVRRQVKVLNYSGVFELWKQSTTPEASNEANRAESR